MLAAPPWPCSSATSSPVNERGLRITTHSTSSSRSPLTGSRAVASSMRRSRSVPGSRPTTRAATATAAGPLTRTMPTPPAPGGVAMAAIVSTSSSARGSFTSSRAAAPRPPAVPFTSAPAGRRSRATTAPSQPGTTTMWRMSPSPSLRVATPSTLASAM